MLSDMVSLWKMRNRAVIDDSIEIMNVPHFSCLVIFHCGFRCGCRFVWWWAHACIILYTRIICLCVCGAKTDKKKQHYKVLKRRVSNTRKVLIQWRIVIRKLNVYSARVVYHNTIANSNAMMYGVILRIRMSCSMCNLLFSLLLFSNKYVVFVSSFNPTKWLIYNYIAHSWLDIFRISNMNSVIENKMRHRLVGPVP